METETIDISARSKSTLSDTARRWIQWVLAALIIFCFAAAAVAQNGLQEINYNVSSSFQPSVQAAIKLSDIPEIKDSVKRIENLKYGINSVPMFPKYQVQPVTAAKMQNEPLSKLYRSLFKGGYSPFYSMPYGEFWISNLRDREKSVGAHLRHFSSLNTQLDDVGYGDFSENTAEISGKQFYKKHTLSGDFKYNRHVVHYYGYDASVNKLDKDFTKQRYQLFEPRVRLVSHYTDSTHVNHDIQLGYYNLQNLHMESENNIRLNALGDLFVQKEKLKVGFLADFYNHKQRIDTLNDLILSLTPSFEARGKKWLAEAGFGVTMDNFRESANFYFYPKLSIEYDIYQSIIVPYAYVNGGLIKNSLRSLSSENPFVDTTLNYNNTNNKVNAAFGLKGNLSARTSYNAKVSYGIYDNLHYYVIDYSSPVQLYNQFGVLYDNTSILTVGGELKYQMKEKFNISARGNYYLYDPKTFERAYHKPDFDLTVSGTYNLQSKFIVRVDIFAVGQQWALSRVQKDSGFVTEPVRLRGFLDANLEVEYRYSKMLSFFARLNNIANQRYYRWERYPSQRFNGMIGITFVPF